MAFLNNAEEKARNHIFKKMNSSSTAFGFYSNNKRGKFNIIKEKNPLLRKEKILSCFQHHIQVMHHWYNSSLKEIPFLLQYLWVKILLHCLLWFWLEYFNIKARRICMKMVLFAVKHDSFFKVYVCFHTMIYFLMTCCIGLPRCQLI